LVAAAASGDQRAWEALIQRYTSRLTRVCRRYGLSSSEADDVVQETWVSLFRHIGQIREPRMLEGWLVTTARRESLRLRAASTREAPLSKAEIDPKLELEFEPGADVKAIEDERMAVLRQAVERLPPSDRAVLGALLDGESSSYDELASTLGMPLGSIGPTRARGLARLRRDLDLSRLIDEGGPLG
jgi:RNA polymerase sigma factor (sigma-70 family)